MNNENTAPVSYSDDGKEVDVDGSDVFIAEDGDVDSSSVDGLLNRDDDDDDGRTATAKSTSTAVDEHNMEQHLKNRDYDACTWR